MPSPEDKLAPNSDKKLLILRPSSSCITQQYVLRMEHRAIKLFHVLLVPVLGTRKHKVLLLLLRPSDWRDKFQYGMQHCSVATIIARIKLCMVLLLKSVSVDGQTRMSLRQYFSSVAPPFQYHARTL